MMVTTTHLFYNTARLAILSALILVGSCRQTDQSQSTTVSASVPTSIHFNGSSYELLRYGKPYFIKGAGGISYFDQLKSCGGNSIRIWDDIDAQQILDDAQRLDLTVMFGLWVEREMEGFDYNNQDAVDKQFERIRKTVLKYRNHPALLLWSVGNEWSLHADNFKVFDEVNRIVRMIHELDPNHPVSTVISPDSERAVWLVRTRCPDVDILAVNSYGLTEKLGGFFEKGGWKKPYLISEYGAPAYWEVPVSAWGAPNEPSSQQKVTFIRQFYQKYISSRPPNCLGAYLFYWGNKQEETHTWFSIFDEQGLETPLVNLMQELWSGHPAGNNQAPVIKTLKIDGQSITDKSFAVSTSLHQAQIQANDPESEPLRYNWEIKPRAKYGGDYVGVPVPAIQGLLLQTNTPTVRFRLPQKPGAYRLFVNVYDTHRHIASANFSFEVTAP